MKTLISNSLNFLVLTFVVISPFFTHAGGNSGGGGGAFVCRNQDGSIKDSELVDLWEAIYIRKLHIEYDNNASVDQLISTAMNKLKFIDPGFYQSVMQDLNYVRSHHEYLPLDVDIAPPSDAQNSYQKPNCPIGGMFYFDGDKQNLGIKNEIFSTLINNTNIAASWTHEAIYKTLREKATYGGEDSKLARKLNSCLYSTDNCLEYKVLSSSLPTDRRVYECEAPGYPISFYLFKVSEGLSQSNPGQTEQVWSIYLKQIENMVYKTVNSIQLNISQNGFSQNGILIGPLLNTAGYSPAILLFSLDTSEKKITVESMPKLTIDSLISYATLSDVVPRGSKIPVQCK